MIEKEELRLHLQASKDAQRQLTMEVIKFSFILCNIGGERGWIVSSSWVRMIKVYYHILNNNERIILNYEIKEVKQFKDSVPKTNNMTSFLINRKNLVFYKIF